MTHALLNNQRGTRLRCRSFQVLWTYKTVYGRNSSVESLANNFQPLTPDLPWKLKQNKYSFQ